MKQILEQKQTDLAPEWILTTISEIETLHEKALKEVNHYSPHLILHRYWMILLMGMIGVLITNPI